MGNRTIESLSELLFNPFETTTDESYSPLNDIDPDIQFFNDLDYHMSLNCNYYLEDSLMEILQKRVPDHSIGNEFSLCHMNIRNLKANLSSFEICLENTGLRFSMIGVTETWLNDVTCNVHNIPGYNLFKLIDLAALEVGGCHLCETWYFFWKEKRPCFESIWSDCLWICFLLS